VTYGYLAGRRDHPVDVAGQIGVQERHQVRTTLAHTAATSSAVRWRRSGGVGQQVVEEGAGPSTLRGGRAEALNQRGMNR